MTTTSTDTNVGTDRTPSIVHYTQNDKAPRPSVTTFNYFEEKLARVMSLTIHELHLVTVQQLEEISEKTILDTFLEVNTQNDQNYLRISKPKPPQQSRTVRLGNNWKTVQPEQTLIHS